MPDSNPATTTGGDAPSSPIRPPEPGPGVVGGDLVAALEQAVHVLDSVPAADSAVADERASLREVVAGHLLPRSRQPDLPMLVAVAGLGGVGKSHLVNLLAGETVTSEGPVRPTTTVAALVLGPEPVPAHLDVLQSVDAAIRTVHATRPDPHDPASGDPATQGTALLDLPAWHAGSGDRTIDRMLDQVDLAIVVTTPARHADAAMWSLLGDLAARGLETWAVLNRAEGPDDEIADELRRMLEAAGLDVPVIVVDDGGSGGDLIDRLSQAGTDPAERLATGRRRLGARLGSVTSRLEALAELVDEVGRADIGLVAIVDRKHTAAADDLRRMIEQGGLAASAGAPWPDTATEVAGIITHRIGDVASRTTAAWLDDPRGASLVGAGGDVLWRHPPEAAGTAVARLREWPDAVGRLVDADARRRIRPSVREALVKATMTRALGGAAPVKRRWARKLRSRVDRLAGLARTGLAETAVDLVSADRDRFVARLGGRPDADLGDRLRATAAALDRASPTRDPGVGTGGQADESTEPADA